MLCLVASSDRIRGKEQKLKHWKLPLTIWNFFFYCEGGQALAWVAQRLWSLHPWRVKSPPDMVLPTSSDYPHLSRGVEPADPQKYLPTSIIL